MNDLDDLSKPLDRTGGNPTLASQSPQRRWSLTTLMAARPNPNHDTRATAEQWNRDYAGMKVKELLVNPAEFPINQPEPSAEQCRTSWGRLEELTKDFRL